jgi:hypothetical protein
VAALDHRSAELLNASRADSTLAGYRSGWNHWLQFVAMTGSALWLDGAPSARQGQREQLCRFIAYLEASVAVQHKSCVGYLNAVRQLHVRHFGEDVLSGLLGEGTLPSLLLDGVERLQRLKGVHVLRKAPLTWDQVCALYPLLSVDKPHVLAAIGLGVVFMLRGSELVSCPRSRHHLLVNDVVFYFTPGVSPPWQVRIRIKSSKCNPEEVFRFFRANGTHLCAVLWLWRHWCTLGASPLGSSRLFPTLTRSSLARAIKSCVSWLRLPEGPQSYSTHSLRRGGAASLLNSGRVHPKFIQEFGRWATDIWLRVYATMSAANQQKLAAIFLRTCHDLRVPPTKQPVDGAGLAPSDLGLVSAEPTSIVGSGAVLLRAVESAWDAVIKRAC